MTEIRLFVSVLVSSIIALFAPIADVMMAMLILFMVNSAFGLADDIINGDGWNGKKALSFGGQCAVYFGTMMSLFLIGHLIHEREKVLVCVNVISIITIWVFVVNIFRNARACCPKCSSMHKVFDILYYVASVQVVEKVPFVQAYLAEHEKDKKRDCKCKQKERQEDSTNEGKTFGGNVPTAEGGHFGGGRR